MKLVTLPVGDLLTNCYLLAAQSGRAAVIDPGDDPERIADRLDKEGMTPAMILLTHGHFDHIGAVKELAARYAIPVYGSEADLVLFTDLKRNRAGTMWCRTIWCRMGTPSPWRSCPSR